MLIITYSADKPEGMSYIIARHYKTLLAEYGVEADIFSLENLDPGFIPYHTRHNAPQFQQVMNELIIPQDRFVIIMPEYNGSFPGFFKAFIDACDIEPCFKGKKVALIGISAGRAGNLRGLDHLTDIFHHMGTEVLSLKTPISRIRSIIRPDGMIEPGTDTENALRKQIELFLKF